MINTYTSYQIITRDMSKSMQRVENQPLVKRDTEYFLENIGKVKTAEEFVDNYRLFNYAMKAFGLQDMAYAKAFMLKALNEGVSDPESFANKMTDKRYAEFVSAFNFADRGESATSYNVARDATMDNYIARATGNGAFPQTKTVIEETAYFTENIGQVESIDDLLDDERMLTYALRAFRLEEADLRRAELFEILSGGVSDPDSPANTHRDPNVAKFATAFNFAELGESTTSYVQAQQETVSFYMRQTLEEDAGNQNEGVRLALYFERKASEITSFFEILGDQALAQVLRTSLGMPDALAQADLDKQVAMFEERIDIKDFSNPEELKKFLTRFTTMWEIGNPSTSTPSLAVALMSPQTEFGISMDTMMAIATMKR